MRLVVCGETVVVGFSCRTRFWMYSEDKRLEESNRFRFWRFRTDRLVGYLRWCSRDATFDLLSARIEEISASSFCSGDEWSVAIESILTLNRIQ